MSSDTTKPREMHVAPDEFWYPNHVVSTWLDESDALDSELAAVKAERDEAKRWLEEAKQGNKWLSADHLALKAEERRLWLVLEDHKGFIRRQDLELTKVKSELAEAKTFLGIARPYVDHLALHSKIEDFLARANDKASKQTAGE